VSGPITRQYGVPNWDEIFGKKDEQPANPKMAKDAVDPVDSSDDASPTDRKEDSADVPPLDAREKRDF
jgi:hypothetical protein